ncbi:MAG: glycosyl hydrolase, partial [Actinobacteria bacterium]
MLKDAGEGTFDVLEQADQYAEARTAPADVVDAGAFSGAYLAAKNLPLVGGSWDEITNKPYDSDAHGYRDPVWSNSGGGAGDVGGRMTALAVDGSTLYAGAADGGVWKRSGTTWTPLTDDAPTLSVGALAIDPSHGLWVGTGEANA